MGGDEVKHIRAQTCVIGSALSRVRNLGKHGAQMFGDRPRALTDRCQCILASRVDMCYAIDTHGDELIASRDAGRSDQAQQHRGALWKRQFLQFVGIRERRQRLLCEPRLHNSFHGLMGRPIGFSEAIDTRLASSMGEAGNFDRAMFISDQPIAIRTTKLAVF